MTDILKRALNKTARKAVQFYNDLALFFFGRAWRVILINEYPKCGASWLKKMLGALLAEDGYWINQDKNKTPLVRPRYLMQRHWLKHARHFHRMIVVLRDPRDVYNSFYFFENYHQPAPDPGRYGFIPDKSDRENLFRYLQHKLLFPEASKPYFSYETFWSRFKSRDDICLVRYEDLRRNPAAELERILAYLGRPKSADAVAACIAEFEFSRMKEREKDTDERAALVRKGEIGDWRNYFNQAAVDLCREKLGSMLLEMGYEQDEYWNSGA